MNYHRNCYTSVKDMLLEHFPEIHLWWGMPNACSKGSNDIRYRSIVGITTLLFEKHSPLMNGYSFDTIRDNVRRIVNEKIPDDERRKRRVTTARMGIINCKPKYTQEHIKFVKESIKDGQEIDCVADSFQEKFGIDMNRSKIYHLYKDKYPLKLKADYNLMITVENREFSLLEIMIQKTILEKNLTGESTWKTIEKVSNRLNSYLEKNGYRFRVNRENFRKALYNRGKRLSDYI